MKIACQSAAKPYDNHKEGSETRALARKDQVILKRPALKEKIQSLSKNLGFSGDDIVLPAWKHAAA